MTFFRSTYNVLQREVMRIRHNFVIVCLMMVLPVASFIFYGVFFSKGVATDMPIAVVDLDHSQLSRRLTSMIDAVPSANVDYQPSNMEHAEHLMREGKIQAVVYIPDNFERDVLSNTPAGVQSWVNGSNITANGLISKDIQTVVTTFSTGIQLQILMKSGLSQAQAFAQVMPVKFDRHILFNPYVNYGYYLMPSFMPIMLALFTLLLIIYVVGSELRNKTAGEWFETAGGNTTAALVGKLLPYTVAMFLVSLLMSNIMHRWLGVPQIGSGAMLIAAGFVMVLAYQSLGVLVITLLANLRLSLSIGGGYSVLAFTFSGLTFPRMAMDPWIQIFTYIFPFTYYTEIFIDQAMRGAPPAYTLHFFGGMFLFMLLPLLCLPRLKKIATDPHYWGRL